MEIASASASSSSFSVKILQPLKHNRDLIGNIWDQEMDPKLAPLSYKKESSEVLSKRCVQQLTNFDNIGGNPDTRLSFKPFLDANWVAPDKIATGYPTQGKMVQNYWECMKELSKTHSVIIVNLMTEKDMDTHDYGRFLLHDQVKLKETSSIDWCYMEVAYGGNVMTGYNYFNWEDKDSADLDVIVNVIESLYKEMNHKSNPVVVCNCRGGVGRTGVFLLALHFYQMIAGGDGDLKKYTEEAVKNTVDDFRQKRGDVQVVQTKKQFFMLYALIERFYNQKFSLRSSA